MRMITGKPIKFLGVGEKTDALEAFHPARMASRILGMGDIVSLVEQAHQKVDKQQADKLAKKIKAGKRFDLSDLLQQLRQIKNMGSMKQLLSKLPGMGIPKAASNLFDDKLLVQMEAIILSMTPQERRFPAIINGSRKKRIAGGSGTQIPDVNKLLKQYTQMEKMLKRFKGNPMMKNMGALPKNLPPDLAQQLGSLNKDLPSGLPGGLPNWPKDKE